MEQTSTAPEGPGRSSLLDCVARIEACLNRPGFNAVAIAGLAGVHPNTIRDCGEPSWNPQVQTLDRIMRIVDGIEALAKS